MSKFYSRPTRLAVAERHGDDTFVQNGLAVTPSQMLEMASEGVPISSVNAEFMYDDGQRTPPDVPVLDRQRGVDLGDLWENQQDIRHKMKKLHKMKGAEDGSAAT